MSLVLAATDVAAIARGNIDAAVPVTGDLRPVETINVRARLEGDLVSVDVREGQRVAQGQVLARFEASEQQSGRESAEADRAAARSELATGQWNLEQSQELFKAGAIAESALRAAQQSVASSRARLAATEARINATNSELRDTRVLAPATGVIEKRLVQTGEHVARGAPMFTLVRNDILELAAALPARQGGAIKEGQRVQFVADGRALSGTVARVSPTVDPATRSLTVYVQVPNPGGVLRGNTFATGRIIGRTATNALLVPTTAIRQAADDGHPYVYRIESGTVSQAPVTLGIIDEGRGLAEVVDGLKDGDRVIVGNVGSVGRGMKVEIIGERGPRARGQTSSTGVPAVAGANAPRPTTRQN
jgi:RND family efflux transporter MFP subunit